MAISTGTTGTAGTSASNAIGEVIALDGTGGRSPRAWAKDPASEQPRLLEIGSPVYANEIIITGPKAVIAIEFIDGSRFDLGRGSEMALGPDIFDPTRVAAAEPAEPAEASPAGAAPLTDVEAIQQALLAGVDPTAELEATAAGPGAGGGGANEGSSFVILDRSNQSTTPESGYETDPIGVSFNQDVQELLLVPPEGSLQIVIGDISPVNEDDLEDGSDLSKESLSSQGTIEILAEDGVGSLVVGGIPVITGGVFTPISAQIDGADGSTSLSFISYDPTTGIVTYEFTLTDNVGHSEGDGTNTFVQDLGIILTDVDGDSAAAVLTLSVIDDIPTAQDDQPGVQDGEGSPIASQDQETVSGNVLDNDTQGADRIPVSETTGPVVPDEITGTYGTLTLNPDGSYDYTVDVEDPDLAALLGGETAVDEFDYTLVDSDGDTSTATLSVTVENTDDGVAITIGDQVQVNEAFLPPNGSEVVGDGEAIDPMEPGYFLVSAPDGISDLTVGGTGGVQLIENEVFTPGGFTTPDGNRIEFVSYDSSTGRVDYIYTLQEEQTHEDGEGANTTSETFNIYLEDRDGDSDSAPLVVTIVDDLPSVDITGTSQEQDALQTGDRLLGQTTAAADYSDNFTITPIYGADGAGSREDTYELNVGPGASGLTDTESDEPVILTKVGDDIVGVTETGLVPVFTIALNPQSGEVTLTQHRAMKHDDPNDPLESSSPLVLSSNDLVTLTLTSSITDGDADPASAQETISIGSTFSFTDDGPSATLAEQPVTEDDAITVDESPLPDAGDGIRSATGQFANNFAAVTDYGTDGPGGVSYSLTLDGSDVGSGLYTLDNNEIVLNQEPDGSITGSHGGTDYFTISVLGSGTNAGDVTFTQLENIRHSEGGDQHDDAETLTTSTGEVPSPALLQIQQTVTDADGDTASVSYDLGAGVFTVEDDGPSATLAEQPVTEDDAITVDESPLPDAGDGIRSATGQFANNFAAVTDYGTDGPGGVSYSLTLDGSDVGSGLYTLDNNEIVLNQEPDGSITGSHGGTDYFTISVLGSGTNAGDVTFTQLENIRHSEGGDQHDDAETLTTSTGEVPSPALLQIQQTVTDADGDTASVSYDLGAGVFTVEDDGPSATLAEAPVTEDDAITVDESPLPDAGDGIRSATGQFANNFAAVTDYGTDGPGGVSYSLTLDGSDVGSGLYTLDNNEIVLNQESDGSITGSHGGTDYFTISVLGSGTNAGDVTFTQLENIRHSEGGDQHDDAETLTTSTGEVPSPALLQIQQTVTDADGDTASVSYDLGAGVFTVEDDGPSATLAEQPVTEDDAITVDESPLPDAGDGIRSATGQFANNFAAVTDYGTDGPGGVSYSLTLDGSDVGSGLYTLDNNEIVLNQEPDGSITGSHGGTDYFTISVLGSGTNAGDVTFTQLENIRHSEGGDQHDDAETLTTSTGEVPSPALLQIQQTVTDADGDTASVSYDLGAGVFTVEDDGPSATLAEQPVTEDDAITVDESPLPDAGDGIRSATGQFANNFAAVTDYGTDGPGGVSYSLTLDGSDVGSGLYTLDNNEIVLNQEPDGSITGSHGGTDYFTISVLGSGTNAGDVTFTQLENIRHSEGGDQHDDAETLTTSTGEVPSPALLQIQQTVTDADGDTASVSYDLGAGVFTVEDDGPSATLAEQPVTEDDAITVDESPLPDAGDGIRSATGQFANNFAAVTDYGTDGPGGVSYSLTLDGSDVGSGLYALADGGGQGEEILLSDNGGVIEGKVGDTLYFTISVITSGAGAGNVTLHLADDRPIWHSDTNNDHDYAETLTTSTGELPNAALLQIQQTVTDADGDTASVSYDLGAGVFKFEDDGPELIAVQHGIITGKDGMLTGQITVVPGADDPLSVTISGTDTADVIYGDQYVNDGGLAAIDVYLPAEQGEPTQFGTLTIQDDGTYVFDMQQDVLPQTFGIDFTDSSSDPGGPVPEVSFSWDDGDGDGNDVIATFTASSTEDDPDYINISGNGMGVDNNLVDESAAESITVEFSESGVTNREFQNELSFAINKLSTTEWIRWTAVDSSGTMRTGLFKGGQGENSTVPMTLVVANLASGTNYDDVEIDVFSDAPGDTFTGIHEMIFEMEADTGKSFRVLSMSASDQETLIPDDLQLNFDVQFTDGDGDSTASAQLGIYIEADDVLGDGYTITGTADSESILGSPGSDAISAGNGDDRIEGAGGNDTMTGGSGSDTFVFNAQEDEGQDTIIDFNASTTPDDPEEDVLRFEDVVDIGGDGIMGLDELAAVVTSVSHDNSNNTTLNLADGGSIELLGFGEYDSLNSLLTTGIEIQLIPPDS